MDIVSKREAKLVSSQDLDNKETSIRRLERLDIVIPVYNEGDTIIDVLISLSNSVKTPYRVLICYDHENDNTLQALAQYPDLTKMDVAPIKNTGQGVLRAVQSGFAASTAAAILVFPADDKFNARIIDSMVQLYTEGCEIVAASRFIPGGCMIGCPWLKAILVKTAAFFLYHFVHLPTRDPTSGFRLFSHRILDQFPIESQQGWCFSLELLVKCHRLGWRVGEVPALWYERTSGHSRFHTLKWLPGYLRWFFYACETRLQEEW
jgi:dolichol-phosphate mannosyltransferase